MATEHYHQSQLDLIDTERFFSLIQGSLDERSRRLIAAAIAEAGGRANLSHVARCANVSRPTPLTSVEVIVNLIAHTTNSKGLRVVAELSESNYATGVKVSDEQMKAINISGDAFRPEWNYTISP